MTEEKQIEELKKLLDDECTEYELWDDSDRRGLAELLVREFGYRKQSEWISVEERLPEESRDVLAYTTVKNYMTLHYSAKHKLFNSYDDDTRTWAERYRIDVTHWIPLPEPPKMKVVSKMTEEGGAE